MKGERMSMPAPCASTIVCAVLAGSESRISGTYSAEPLISVLNDAAN